MDEERTDEGVTEASPEGEEDGSRTTDEAGDDSEVADDSEAAGAEEEPADDGPPPGADSEGTASDDGEAGDEAVSQSGTPGVPPVAGDDRRSPEGLPITTTTGDPSKDFRGPSVTEEARHAMGDDPALDEPGYGDLGHAEDRDVLGDD